MKKAVLVVNSLAGAGILTLVLAAGTLLFLMFTTPEAPSYREGLFGGVFFRTEALPDGGVSGSLGVASGFGLAVVFIGLTFLLLAVQAIYAGLVRYRNDLLAQRAA